MLARCVPLSCAILLVAGGCVPYGHVSYSASVHAPPPQPYVEVVGPAPGHGFVWVNGYWWWDGADYVWIRGYWARPPAAGYVWVHSGWVAEGGTYRFVHGRWAGPSHTRHVHYVHPAPRVRVRVDGGGYRAAPPRGRVRVRVR